VATESLNFCQPVVRLKRSSGGLGFSRTTGIGGGSSSAVPPEALAKGGFLPPPSGFAALVFQKSPALAQKVPYPQPVLAEPV